MSRRAELNFTSIGLGLLFISVFSIFLSTYMGGLLNLFPAASLNVSQSETYNQLSHMANLSEDLSGRVGDTSTSDDEFEVKVYKSGFAAIKLIFYDSPVLLSGMLNAFAVELGLPSWIVGFAIACLVLPLAILLFNVFTKSFLKL